MYCAVQVAVQRKLSSPNNVQPICDRTACVCCPVGVISSPQISSTTSSATLQIAIRFDTSNCPQSSYTTTQVVPAATLYLFGFTFAGQRGQVTLTTDNSTLTFKNLDYPQCKFNAVRTSGSTGTSKPIVTAMFLGLALKQLCTFSSA